VAESNRLQTVFFLSHQNPMALTPKNTQRSQLERETLSCKMSGLGYCSRCLSPNCCGLFKRPDRQREPQILLPWLSKSATFGL